MLRISVLVFLIGVSFAMENELDLLEMRWLRSCRANVAELKFINSPGDDFDEFLTHAPPFYIQMKIGVKLLKGISSPSIMLLLDGELVQLISDPAKDINDNLIQLVLRNADYVNIPKIGDLRQICILLFNRESRTLVKGKAFGILEFRQVPETPSGVWLPRSTWYHRDRHLQGQKNWIHRERGGEIYVHVCRESERERDSVLYQQEKMIAIHLLQVYDFF